MLSCIPLSFLMMITLNSFLSDLSTSISLGESYWSIFVFFGGFRFAFSCFICPCIDVCAIDGIVSSLKNLWNDFHRWNLSSADGVLACQCSQYAVGQSQCKFFCKQCQWWPCCLSALGAGVGDSSDGIMNS
jgi:hypothetical protein